MQVNNYILAVVKCIVDIILLQVLQNTLLSVWKIELANEVNLYYLLESTYNFIMPS